MNLELYNMDDMELEALIKSAVGEIRRRKMDYYNRIIDDAKKALEIVSTSGVAIYANGKEIWGGYNGIDFKLPEIKY